jgi:hypothetical protein
LPTPQRKQYGYEMKSKARMNMNKHLKLTSLVLSMALSAGLAHADERTDLEVLKQTTINLIQILVQQGVLTQAKADELVKQAQTQAVAKVQPSSGAAAVAATTVPGEVRVQYVPEFVRKQISETVRAEVVAQAKAERWGDVNAVPEWADRLRFSGDVRVGYENDTFGSGNAPEVYFQTQGDTSIKNSLENRDRLRMRARLALDATVTPETTAGLRLTTGNASDPTSTTQTLGQYDNKYSFTLDRAFVKYQPQSEQPWMTLTAGRMPNPYFSTNLVWNDNLNFEGVALTADPYSSLGTQALRPYATVGAFALQDIERSASNQANNKYMIGTQVGLDWVPSQEMRAKLGLALYDYHNLAGQPNTNDNPNLYDQSAAVITQRGNTRFNINNSVVDSSGNPLAPIYALASDYTLVNLTGTLDLNLDNPVHLMLTADYVRNIGFDSARVQSLTGQDAKAETLGYMARAAVGMPTMLLRGDWQMSLAYRYLEKDAVVDAFTDSDFGLGGTNNQGYVLGADYATGKNTWWTARYYSSSQVSGLPYSVDVLQLYFNAKF